MLFNSLPFLVFALVFFLLWPLLRKRNLSRWLFITVMSLIFYGWWDWRFLFLIIASGLLDYYCGLWMVRWEKWKKFFLIVSLIGNIGSLAVFKYSLLIAEVADTVLLFFNIPVSLKDNIPGFALILPVGISFYTFQSMSYSIDVYQGNLKPVKNILHFFSFLTMFPQLVAGPIIRAKDLLQQLNRVRIPNSLEKWNGIKLIVFGLFQKTVIADNVAYLVNSAYGGTTTFDSAPFWWLALISFALQIYFDFSGYSLMARGLAKYMGYHFKMNFNHPYHSLSIKEFWMRWHISLSTWFRDYVYIPLGGSRKGFFAGIIFMSLTMVVSGLWHGAAFTFVIWGALHALYLAIERISGWPRLLAKNKAGIVLVRLIILFQVLIAWNFFRAEDLTQASAVFEKLFSSNHSINFYDHFINSLWFLALGILIEAAVLTVNRNFALKRAIRNVNGDLYITCFCLFMTVFFRGPQGEFIYFQF